jgi:hypothetical protein
LPVGVGKARAAQIRARIRRPSGVQLFARPDPGEALAAVSSEDAEPSRAQREADVKGIEINRGFKEALEDVGTPGARSLREGRFHPIFHHP